MLFKFVVCLLLCHIATKLDDVVKGIKSIDNTVEWIEDKIK